MNVSVQNFLMKLLILKTPCICLDINLSHLSSWQKHGSPTPGEKKKNTYIVWNGLYWFQNCYSPTFS